MLLGLIGLACIACTPEEKTYTKEAEKLANEVVASQCFADQMKSINLVWTNGRTPQGVIEHLRNTRVTARVHYYFEESRTVGHRTPGTLDVYFNHYHHDLFNTCDRAGNATHEWSHILGYDHPFSVDTDAELEFRNRTVPYAINRAFYNCCQGNFLPED